MIDLENDIESSLQVLKQGGIILYPTDTIWGIGCDATDAEAIKKIFDLKQRPENKSMIILVSDVEMIRNYVSDPSEKILSFISIQTKPTTAIFEKAVNLPVQLVGELATIAVRIVKDDFCTPLIQQLNKPLISTSANISGEKFPKNFSEVSAQIKNGVDYVVQHRQNDFTEHLPSSIIKLGSNDEIEIIR